MAFFFFGGGGGVLNQNSLSNQLSTRKKKSINHCNLLIAQSVNELSNPIKALCCKS